MNRKILGLLIIYLIFAFVLSLVNLQISNLNGIAWPFVIAGIFIWTDGLIIAPFLIGGCLWLIFKNKFALTGLFFASYWLIRSFIEVEYALLAQFSLTKRPWEASWQGMSFVQQNGIMNMYVIWQLVFTGIFIFSLLLFVRFLKEYLRIKTE